MNKKEQEQLILEKVKEWAGGSDKAQIWYKNEEIPALGCTPEQAVESGYFDALIEYIQSIELGGYA